MTNPIQPEELRSCKWCTGKFLPSMSDASNPQEYDSREHELKDEHTDE